MRVTRRELAKLALSLNRWTMPATIEMEYEAPEGSDAVKEVARCLQFCRDALA
jgi:hypothetical protein